MGSKIRTFGILAILFTSVLFSFHFLEDTIAEDNETKEVLLYLHGDVNNASLNTSYGYYEEQHVLTTSPEDHPSTVTTNQIFLGEWVTEPIAYPMNIQGQVMFSLYAMGDLRQVRFIAYLTVNGVGVSNDMTTPTQDLNETFPTEFISDTVNITEPLELNTTDTVGFRLSLEHRDLEYYDFLNSIGKNVTLILGVGYRVGSFVALHTDSMHITEITGRDDPAIGNMLVTATIKCSFGVEDFNYAKAESDYGSFSKRSETFVDDATVEVEWEWDYTVSEGGSYPVEITAKDMNFNSWKLTEDVHITTPNTEIDFSVSRTSITFSNEPQKDKNTTIIAKITGSGKRWKAYQVEIEFYDDSDLIEKVEATVSRGGTNEVTVLWVPDDSGVHRIKVKIDPDDYFKETDEDNNEATKNVDVKEGSGGGAPGFEGWLLIGAIAIVLFFGTRSHRGK